jgi:fructose-1,6-bisphosphatase/inositol monophosphatase family enzyme
MGSDEGSLGTWANLALRVVSASLKEIRSLAGRGTEVVEGRPAGYREWDPEVIRVDKAAERIILEEIKTSGLRAIILTEESGRVEQPASSCAQGASLAGARHGQAASGGQAGQSPVYFIVDPFDGSLLYRRQIPAFWYTCLGIYSSEGEPLTAAVADVSSQQVDFCNEQAAFTGRLENGELRQATKLRPSQVEELSEAFVETYLMKPAFMYPTAIRLEPLLSRVKFILPNGGPCGFADVATGRVDVYIAVREAAVEVFTGMPIAQRAGCVVTTWDGKEVQFNDDINREYSIVCSSNQGLHEQILEALRGL